MHWMTAMAAATSENPHPVSKFLFHLFVFSLLAAPSSGDPRATEAALICGTRRAPDAESFVQNFGTEMAAIADLVSSDGWGTHPTDSSNSSSPPPSLPIYGLAQCHWDLSRADCLLCFSECRARLPGCLPNASARVFLDGCFLRYDSYNFYSEAVDASVDRAACGGDAVEGGPAKEESWRSSVVEMVGKLTEVAVRNGGFGVWDDGGGGAYGLAQCWKTVGKEGCRECLEKAGREVERCLPAREGRGLNAGCYLRYSDHKFYDDGQNGGGGSKKALIFALVPSIASVVFLSTLFVGICYRRKKSKIKESKHLIKISAAISKSHLYFKYETLERATDHFNPTNKLGQGGAGSVYKGSLPDGTTIAVKRLFFNTRQWADEFFNEVNLISKLQHKNLVKLLGCSIEGPESLLVYEYIPNKSLDLLLLDRGNTQVLTWKQRLQIIGGVAEGLAYLHHQGPETRIIHRDIKCSNILLDEGLNARISDFGLARGFSADQTHLSTAIAGTLGYMAPEYLVHGKLTEKADVYSFGLVVLEIVCGRQNIIYGQGSSSLLQKVWKNYTSGTLMECLDQRLKEETPLEEASYILQIGLLCTQASIALRPSMLQVVQMLTSRDCSVPTPTQPPFMSTSLVDTSKLES